jgi:hypothetical protein
MFSVLALPANLTCDAPDRILDRTSLLATVHIGKPYRDSNCVAERTWSRPPVSLLNGGSNCFSAKIPRSLQMIAPAGANWAFAESVEELRDY